MIFITGVLMSAKSLSAKGLLSAELEEQQTYCCMESLPKSPRCHPDTSSSSDPLENVGSMILKSADTEETCNPKTEGGGGGQNL